MMLNHLIYFFLNKLSNIAKNGLVGCIWSHFIISIF